MLNRLQQHIAKFCINRPKITIFVILFLMILIASGIRFVEQDDNMINLLPEDIGSRKLFLQIQEDFGLTEYMYVAIGNKNKKIFNSKDSSYTNNTLMAINNLSDDFNNLPIVDRVISLSTAQNSDGDKELKKYLELDSSQLSNKNIQKFCSFLFENPIMTKRLINFKEPYSNLDFLESEYANIIIVPENNEHYVELTKQIEKISKKYENEYEFYFGGQAYVTGAVPRMVLEDVLVLLAFGIILMTTILYINLRSIRSVILILFTIITSLTAMMGFMGWIYYFTNSENFYFTLMNTSMPIVLLTIANSDAVHILSRFSKELRKFKKTKPAIIETMKHMAMPIFLTSITTASAFLMLVFSPVSAMIGYGIVLALGIMWAWFLSITLIPALISIKLPFMNWEENKTLLNNPSFVEKLMKYFGDLVSQKPKKVLLTGFIIVIISSLGIYYINVEVQYTKMFRKGNPIKDSAEFLDEYMTGNVNLIIRASDTSSIKNPFKKQIFLNQISQLQNALDTLPNVKSTMSLADVIKQTYQNTYEDEYNFTYKNESINDSAYINEYTKFFNNYYIIPEDRKIEPFIEFEDCGLDDICIGDLGYIGPDLDGTEGNNKIDTLTIIPSDSIIYDAFSQVTNGDPDILNPLLNSTNDTTIIIALMKTFSTKEVYSYKNKINNIISSINKNDNLPIKYETTGMMDFITDFVKKVVESSITSLALSILIICLIASYFYKSFRYGMVATFPLLAAAIVNFGLMGWFGITLTHMTAMLSSIIIGVGVDFSIHYISEYRTIKKQTNKDLSKKTIDNVGNPIILDAWSNMSFGALAFSKIIPLSHIGGLMVFAMIATSIGSLTVLASAMELLKNKFK